MSTGFIQLLVYGILVAGATMLGGYILFPGNLHTKLRSGLKYLLALGAGYMLAITFIEILPKTIILWQAKTEDHLYIPMVLLLVGYLLTQFFEHTIAPHFHLGEEVHTHGHELTASSAYAAVGGLLIHAFFDGVSISAAYIVEPKLGLLMFLAVFLHKFPEGFTISSMLLASEKGLREVLTATGVVGLVTLIGVLGFYFVGSSMNSLVPFALPLAGGVTLYVAASDLVPEVNHHGGRNPLVSVCVFLGVALFFGLHTILHSLAE